MKKLHTTMSALAGVGLLGMSLVGCSGSDDAKPKPSKSESAPAAAEETESAVPETTQPAETEPATDSAQAAEPSESSSDAANGGSGDSSSASEGGTSIKAGVSDHFPDKVGEWKIRRSGGTVSWYKGDDLGYRMAAGPELSAPAKDQASEIIKKDAVRISAGYCGLNAGDTPTCYMDLDGKGNFALSSEVNKPLSDLTQFAEEFTKQVPTN